MLIQTQGFSILTDPVWSNASAPSHLRDRSAPTRRASASRNCRPIDVVIVSHNHYDHLDVATLKRLVHIHNPLIVTPLGNDTIIRRSIANARIQTMDWVTVSISGTACLPLRARASLVGAGRQRSALCALGRLRRRDDGGLIYHIGDTGFHEGIKYRAAREKYGRFRLAILPIGAYEPRWFMKAQHQNPEEAVEGMKLCNAAYAAGITGSPSSSPTRISTIRSGNFMQRFMLAASPVSAFPHSSPALFSTCRRCDTFSTGNRPHFPPYKRKMRVIARTVEKKRNHV